ncbi:flagellar synthesis anti-sigma-D factor [Paenibacillus darwinianus]|uniref:Negative regulator of flagellin synthesis n=1 Tax=Paenibacillus darwinianus TaxID=1380763 RepID=A0A9W5S1A1_9BACL|nr:flagellar biosynthesis anti-sigma factor FlgM [Paenibacillus darwinianus]EXX88234.1 flagellar synthesis anti-sigma-D factor [Paenibacillus darwinianus]EXX89009.1 flagellar synthesis anti-sigma-D factor [Paenibacillus darwinianus]EXX89416.1 flagellar synthesis anti-sigma-D factor [Paenibacillus darwinianus]
MKINHTNRIGAVNSYQKQNEHRADGTAGKKRRDEVQISAEAKELLSYSRMNEAERAGRVEQLKQSVSTGNYQVDAGKIADKLLPYLK